jgi:hypothetical protein
MRRRFIFILLLAPLLLSSFTSNSQDIEFGAFSEGVSAFVKDGKMGFVDEKENIVLPTIFDFPESTEIPVFREGLCIFYQKKENSKEGDWNQFNFGYIDRNFNVIIQAKFPYFQIYCHGLTAAFSGGYAIVNEPKAEQEYTHIVIDKSGNQIGKPFNSTNGCTAACLIYPEIAEGLIVVGDEGNCGYREAATGRLIIPYKYSRAGPFSEGVAAVEVNGKYITLIDKSGMPIINKKFYTVKKGSQDPSLYSNNYGCTDPGGFVNGKMIIQYFENDGTGDTVFALIDKKGNILLKKKINDIYSDPDFENYLWPYGDPH